MLFLPKQKYVISRHTLAFSVHNNDYQGTYQLIRSRSVPNKPTCARTCLQTTQSQGRRLPLMYASGAQDEQEIKEAQDGALIQNSQHASSLQDDDLKVALPLPTNYLQKKLPISEVKALRTRSNTLAKEGAIQRIICGQNGITQSFLNACADMLGKHEFLRVKLGEGAGLERREAAQKLERYLDALSVHEVGFTITLYRQPGLPRPSNCPSYSESQAAASANMLPSTATHDRDEHLVDAEKKKNVPRQRTSHRSAERVAASKATAKIQPKGPSEITVL
ncbi:hypothetical protein CEUSTIGMA_g10785.t1 [Chlamydomonas eustigma]|uniref:CRM domain-containing protein n=1 Tax=Chlamydomonas eustigma TaxID=1157962 RepID=A0A250XKM8_9CHLO|nr:hypothetical protein CEUSTIGMA_g10785.t1 [Chlamydomonas eustigma]|eukprot:GAX83360.1 hypothetical protein CEUSTIGMA_g10785.t1 [Chlamydomonas eustigma]